MMRLSKMLAVDSTVGPDGSSPIAEAILSHWGFDARSVSMFRSSSNFVYAFRQEGCKRFLRFISTSEREKGQIEEEIRLLVWLKEAGIRVPDPVRSHSGTFVETVVTELDSFHAVVFTALAGQYIGREHLKASHYKIWGAALGKLHAAVRRYQPGDLRRACWQDHLIFVGQHLKADQTALCDELAQISSWAESLSSHPDNFGLIHFDFELDNLCWQEDDIGILDFDDCAYYWYAADVVFALGALFEKDDYVDNPLFQLFVEGYREHALFDPALYSQVPMFRKMGALISYAKLIRAIDVPVNEAAPEWFQSLHAKLTACVVSYRASLEQRRL